MRAERVIAALWLLAASAGAALGQGYGGLGAGGDAFAQVTPGRDFAFPEDHLPHPGFRIEWWYVTANLQASDGTPMGVEWTLFRQAAAPGGAVEGWASPQLWMGHAAVTTPDRHALAEQFARGGIGQARVAPAPFTAWIDDWEMRGTGAGDPLDAVELTARGDDFSYALSLTAEWPLVLQGQQGYSVKSGQGQASYYYSQPFYRASGTVTLEGQQIPVTGHAWLDREWSSQALTAEQTGWDWFAMHLPGGEKLMAYRLRNADGGVYAPGTLIAADGSPRPLADGELEITPLGYEEVAGRRIPVRWRLRYPAGGIDVETQPLNAQSYMATAFPYWEGPIRFEGTHQGVGYLEMTGY